MTTPDQYEHQAFYDEDGNIRIPNFHGDTPEDGSENEEGRESPQEEATSEKGEESPKYHQILGEVRGQVIRTTGGLMQEGTRQYHHTARDLVSSIKGSHRILRSGGRKIWGFCAQPVWILNRKKEPKQYNRLTLFCVDTVRFGGTFAAIFGALFVSLNYQSFMHIVEPFIDPVEHTRSVTAMTSDIDAALKEKILRSPSLATAGREKGDLLSFLTEVGPPENRMIIPALSLNIPLVTPSYEAVLQENWEMVEEDIQDALQYGVVHYPGTARPGQAGNFFVTGHSSYYPWASGKYKTVFARLHEMEVGDEYWVYYGGDKHRYIVTDKKEVKPSNVDVLDQPTNKRTATLMTCTPVGTTLRRLILNSQEVDPITGIALKPGQRGNELVVRPKLESLPI